MYHPSKYEEHNKSLKRFSDAFNEYSRSIGGGFEIKINQDETFRDDGYIFDPSSKKTINFDWEKRVSYYEKCGFPFPTFGQFERKISKPEIELSIQCSKSEDCFCIAWHEDLKKEKIIRLGSNTENGGKEYTGKRFTTKFVEIRYSDIDNFYKILEEKFDSD